MPKPDLQIELELHQAGYRNIAGIDEAGRGAWAGPVVAAAVILPIERKDLLSTLQGVNDSKRLSPNQRSKWAVDIKNLATAIGVGQSSQSEVDSLGLIAATRTAMMRAIKSLPVQPTHVVIDYISLPTLDIPQHSFPYGDARVLSIAAASIIAKVTRDEVMVAVDSRFPEYGFARNKGYGTQEHQVALDRYGPCRFHRFSYSPVAASAMFVKSNNDRVT